MHFDEACLLLLCRLGAGLPSGLAGATYLTLPWEVSQEMKVLCVNLSPGPT